MGGICGHTDAITPQFPPVPLTGEDSIIYFDLSDNAYKSMPLSAFLSSSTAAATYVPYVGANADVDLGAFLLAASQIVTPLIQSDDDLIVTDALIVQNEQDYKYTMVYSGSLPVSWVSAYVGSMTQRNCSVTIKIYGAILHLGVPPVGYMIGDLVTGATSGAIGQITNIVGNDVYIDYVSTGVHFQFGEALINGIFPPFPITLPVAPTYHWQENGGPFSPGAVVNAGVPVNVGNNNQFLFIWGSAVLNGNDFWVLNYSQADPIAKFRSRDGQTRFQVAESGQITAWDLTTGGRNLDADGQVGLYGIGALDGGFNNTRMTIDDVNSVVQEWTSNIWWVTNSSSVPTLEVSTTANTVAISNAYVMPTYYPAGPYLLAATGSAPGTDWIDPATLITAPPYLASTQVAFGDGANAITSDGSLTYDMFSGVLRTPIVRASQLWNETSGVLTYDLDNYVIYDSGLVYAVLPSNRTLNDGVANVALDWLNRTKNNQVGNPVDDWSGNVYTCWQGDLSGSGNSTQIALDDATQFLQVFSAFNVYLNFNMSAGRYQIGDINGVVNPVYLDMRPQFNNTILHSGAQFVVQSGTDQMLHFDNQFWFYVIGDYSGANNSTYIYISDLNQEVSIASGGVALIQTDMQATSMNRAVAEQNMQRDTASNTTVNIADDVIGLIYNPASMVTGVTINLPASPKNGQRCTLLFGGTVTAGAVITGLTIGGPTFGSIPSTATVNTILRFWWDVIDGFWRRDD